MLPLLSLNSLVSRISMRFAYSDAILDHYENPRNVGSMDSKNPNVGTAMVGHPKCGDVVKLQIEFDQDQNIKDACFKAYGCGSAIATTSYSTELLKGKSVDEALEIKNQKLAKDLKLPMIKHHCSALAEQAIHAAVKDWKSKGQNVVPK